MRTNPFISALSAHLFWDIDQSKLNEDDNKSIIIQRVMEYGLMKDWDLIKEKYGLDEILHTAKNLRNLNPKALSFIATITDTPLESFKCYTSTQSQNPPWHF